MAADFQEGATCGPPFGETPGVGHGVEAIVAAIRARPGVVSTGAAAVTIGGYDGQMLDLHLAPSWIKGCQAPEGHLVGMPILLEAGSKTKIAPLTTDYPLRLILLDLTDGRTMSIAIFNNEPFPPSTFERQVAAVMPVIESFEFHTRQP